MKKKSRSLRFNVAFYFFLLIGILLLVIWLFETFLITPYYEARSKTNLKNRASKYYNEYVINNLKIDEIARESMMDNIHIYIATIELDNNNQEHLIPKNGEMVGRFSFDFNDSHVRMHTPAMEAFKIKGNAQSYFFKLTQPLIQTAKSDLFFYTGYDLVNANTSWKNNTPNPERLSTYNLHVWRSGLYGMTDDSYGRWIGNLGIDFGMGGNGHGAPQDTTFFKLTGGATRVQRLTARTVGIVRANAMYSPNKLFAAEQFQLGGPYTWRGYQPAELIGDYGVSGTVEYRFPFPFLNHLSQKLDERVRLAIFYDFGWLGENGDVYNYPKQFLQSVGCGAYLSFTDWLTAQVGVGFPLGEKKYGESTAIFYFSVNSDLDRLIPLRNPQKI